MDTSKPARHEPAGGRPIEPGLTIQLKGVAMLGIVFHNFFNRAANDILINEFTFLPNAAEGFAQHLVASPAYAVQLVSTFLGHYFVQVFTFLSAYGLTVQYVRKRTAFGPLIKDRLAKLYVPFALVVVATALIQRTAMHQLPSYALKLMLVSNFVPGQADTPVGPWWFVPFIAQFYVLQPWMARMTMRHSWRFTVAVSAAGAAFTYGWFAVPALASSGVNPMHNVVGHLPELAIGVLYAVHQSRPGAAEAAVSAVLFVLSLFFYPLWYFGYPAVALFLVFALIRVIVAAPPEGRLARALNWVGDVSLALFLVHGPLRSRFLFRLGPHPTSFRVLAFGLAYAVVAMFVAFLVNLALRPVMQRLRARRATP